jgi:hypothetical protein
MAVSAAGTTARPPDRQHRAGPKAAGPRGFPARRPAGSNSRRRGLPRAGRAGRSIPGRGQAGWRSAPAAPPPRLAQGRKWAGPCARGLCRRGRAAVDGRAGARRDHVGLNPAAPGAGLRPADAARGRLIGLGFRLARPCGFRRRAGPAGPVGTVRGLGLRRGRGGQCRFGPAHLLALPGHARHPGRCPAQPGPDIDAAAAVHELRALETVGWQLGGGRGRLQFLRAR